MLEKIKQYFAILMIVVLLPYLCTFFIQKQENVSVKSVLGHTVDIGENVEEQTIEVDHNGITLSVNLEEYIIGSTAAAISKDYLDEALKAQMIISRTYLLKEIEDSGMSSFKADDKAHSYWSVEDMQRVWGVNEFSETYKRFKDLAAQTDNMVLYYDDKIIVPAYHAISAGHTRNSNEMTESGQYPYLKSVESKTDIEAENYLKIESFKNSELPLLEIVKTDSIGYVNQVKADGEILSGEELRKEYSLNSSCFTIEPYEEETRIITKGLGHGLGLSQYGANEMAKKGEKCEAILAYYFPGTQIKK